MKINEQPTEDQARKIEELINQGYVWNRQKSISAAGVVLEKGEDFWIFTFNGEILHNPIGLTISLN